MLQAQLNKTSGPYVVPTLTNLPVRKEQKPFNYSLCESIDYQQESLLGKQQQSNYYSLDQVQQLLN